MQPTPHNTACAAPLQLVHVHVVDDFNTDGSLDVAGVLLASRALATCAQIRVSTSGLHPDLSAHPKVASAKPAIRKQFAYGTTRFSDAVVRDVLGWSEVTQQRNVAIAQRPQHFCAVERACRTSVLDAVAGGNGDDDDESAACDDATAATAVGDDHRGDAADAETCDESSIARARNTNPKSAPISIVLCCSRDVFDGVCGFYEALQAAEPATATFAPHSVYVMLIDTKFCQQPLQTAAATAAATATTSVTASAPSVGGAATAPQQQQGEASKPTQGQLYTSLVVEALGLMHVRHQPASRVGGDAAAAAAARDPPQTVSPQWRERFAAAVKQFEQLRRAEVVFRAFVL